MIALKSMRFDGKNLFVISPNFRSYIRDEIIQLRQYFEDTTVIIPKPFFSELIYHSPRFIKKFIKSELFIKNVMEIYNIKNIYVEKDSINFIFPRYFTLPMESFRKKSYLRSTQSAIKSIKDGTNIDLIHAHRLDINGYIGANLKEIYGSSLVLNTHGSDVYELPFRDKYYLNITKFMINKADHIIAVSKSDAECLLALGASPKMISIVPTGFDDHVFRPYPMSIARSNLNLPQDKMIILCVATLHEVKGHTYLLDAISIVSKMRDNVILVIVGSGPMFRVLERKVKELGLINVLFAGYKNHDEVPLWMNAANIIILPSLNEGLPTVITEAMACGKPVIGTRVGGIPDIISSEELGVIVDPKDPIALSDAIIYAISKEWKEETILNHSNTYSLSHLTDKILNVYENILY